jgi:hypothetical protein
MSHLVRIGCCLLSGCTASPRANSDPRPSEPLAGICLACEAPVKSVSWRPLAFDSLRRTFVLPSALCLAVLGPPEPRVYLILQPGNAKIDEDTNLVVEEQSASHSSFVNSSWGITLPKRRCCHQVCPPHYVQSSLGPPRHRCDQAGNRNSSRFFATNSA